MVRIEYENGGTLNIVEGDKIYEGSLGNITAVGIEVPDSLNFMNYSEYDDGSVECWWNGEKTENYPKDFIDNIMESRSKITATMNYYFDNPYTDSESESDYDSSGTETVGETYDELSDTETFEPSYYEDIYRTWIVSRLNDKAYEFGFQNFDEAIGFSGSSVKSLKSKVNELVTLRDSMYAVLIDVVSKIRSGELETPPELEDFIQMVDGD